MNDEKYVFLQESREKKNISNSARNRRTHCGKGGRVKLPSDYLSKKELNAMSGECKSYKLNEPMLWKEFKSMPDDIKITYIKMIREKFGATDRSIAQMMLTNTCSFSQEMKRLAISNGRETCNRKWDKETFLKWVNHIPISNPVEPAVEAQEAVEEVAEETTEVVEVPVEVREIPVEESKPYVPKTGFVVFEGRIEDVLKAVGMMLKGADVNIRINWDVMDNG